MDERKSDTRIYRKNKKARINGTTSMKDMLKNMGEFAREPVPTDIDGSYTGVPYDETETPIQDADDL